MSEELQRRARALRDAARRRAAAAWERAARRRNADDGMLAKVHETAAEAQTDAAKLAEGARVADAAIEGDRLGEDARASDSPAPDRRP